MARRRPRRTTTPVPALCALFLGLAATACTRAPPALDPSLGACWAFEGEDADCNGTPEDRCRLLTFTATGAQQTFQNDEDCDGRLSNRSDHYEDGYGESCVRSRFDARGLEIARDYDRFCSGNPDMCYGYDWDDAGRKTLERQVPNCHGPGLCYRFTYTGAATVATREESDEGCDGTADFCIVRVLDAADRVLGERWDEGCDGRPDRNCQERTFRDDGQVLTERWDLDCDGTWDNNCTENTYDAAGKQVLQRFDFECDGAAPECRKWVRDAAGRVIEEGLDRGCDGTPDKECRFTTWDQEGRVTSVESRFDCTTRDDCLVTTWSADGLSFRNRRSTPCDAPPDRCFDADLDAAGHFIATRLDTGCDGDADLCTETVYDDERILLETTDEGCDGKGDTCIVRAWDGAGNRLADRVDEGCDGRPDHCTVRETTCTVAVLP